MFQLDNFNHMKNIVLNAKPVYNGTRVSKIYHKKEHTSIKYNYTMIKYMKLLKYEQ